MSDAQDCVSQCKENINNRGGVPCPPNICEPIEAAIDAYCEAQGLPPGTAVPQIMNGKPCYCCCFCVIDDIAVAMPEKEFAFMRDISEGDSVLVYDLSLDSRPGAINYTSGPMKYDGAGPLRYVAYKYGNQTRRLVVTPEQMFLMRSGKLKAAQHIAEGDELRRADGGISRVRHTDDYEGRADVYHIRVANSDTEGLDGRLINLNGVVCGDFSVQVSYFAGQLDGSMVEPL